VEDQSRDSLECDHGQADRVWTVGRARREDPASLRAAWRQYLRAPCALVKMEPEDDPDALPTLEIRERMLEIATGEELDRAPCALRGPRLPGGARAIDERRLHDANRCEANRCEGDWRHPGSFLPHLPGAPSRYYRALLKLEGTLWEGFSRGPPRSSSS